MFDGNAGFSSKASSFDRSKRTNRPTLRDRVAQAYFEYGRFCSAHPAACISKALLILLLLSYPAFSRIKLPVSSPMDVHWSTEVKVEKDDTTPEWLMQHPAVYLQQIVIRGAVEPWQSLNLTSEHAVRGPLSRAFTVRETIVAQASLSSSCQHIHSAEHTLLPKTGCLLLSPTLFWNNDETKFTRDDNVLATIFTHECSPSFCLRDILLGMPTGMTGIKAVYQTNRKRSIDYILTLFLHQYDSKIAEGIRESLSKQNFQPQVSTASDENTFVHVFYRPRTYLSDWFPLVFSYGVFMLYIYYSASKFEMVSSRAGLSIAAAFTVASTLLITTGICAHLDLQSSLWSSEIFPYIALILGLENILCITRSVVYTPPSLDVSSRISHGLAQEGYTLTKYFILELLFLCAGFLTGVSEIQDFCIFASIGLVVDFYMQLFFYAPVLCIDLHRLSSEEKRRFSRMLFSTQIPQLKSYPSVSCPIKKVWPGLFERARKRRVKRTLSDSNIDEKDLPPQLSPNMRNRSHRRSVSSVKSDFEDNSSTSYHSFRLKVLYFVTRTRILQRSMIVLFVLWTIWLGFIVHRQWPGSGNSTDEATRFGVSNRILETAPQQWGEWQRKTFKWWPVVFNEYNMSLSGSYITFLPPIVMKVTIPPWDPSLTYTGGADDVTPEKSDDDSSNELQSRIFWLEQQLRVYMAICAIFLFSTVILFISYALFWGRWRNGWKRDDQLAKEAEVALSKKNATKSFVESVPLIFTGHRFPVEFAVLNAPNQLISVCQDGRVISWDANTGERKLLLNRTRTSPQPAQNVDPDEVADPRPRANSMLINAQHPITVTKPPNVWSLHATQNVVLLGCADGTVEIGSLERNKLLAVYGHSKAGVVHVTMRGNRVVLARLDGTLEVFEVEFTTTFPLRVVFMGLISEVRAHQKPISHLVDGPLCYITASHDHTVKLWDARSFELLYTLHAHNAPVTSVCVDHHSNILFTSCEEGVICWWNIETGELIRSTEDANGWAVQLAVCEGVVLGLGLDGQLSVWDKTSGQLMTRMAPSEITSSTPLLERRCVVALSNDLAATSYGCMVSFWDLTFKALIKQVEVGGPIDGLIAADARSVICYSSNNMYRINVPVVRLK